MPKGYWIVRVDVADQEKYKAYIAGLTMTGCASVPVGGVSANPRGSD